MSSWSDNRSKNPEIPKEVILRKIDQVNKVLEKLSKDEDLHDDLKDPKIIAALDHWTGRKRMTPEEAETLQDNRRAIYVLQRLQMLQSVCKDASTTVPFDHFIKRISKLNDDFIKTTFGQQYIENKIIEKKSEKPVIKENIIDNCKEEPLVQEKKISPNAPIKEVISPKEPTNKEFKTPEEQISSSNPLTISNILRLVISDMNIPVFIGTFLLAIYLGLIEPPKFSFLDQFFKK